MAQPPTDRLLQYFSYDHLPGDLARVAQKFADLAHWMVAELPDNQQRHVALTKLMEGKDAAVRTLRTKPQANLEGAADER
jgi:hypothetical protein